MSNNQVYKLSDPAIAQIAKLVQVAILTGTDVVDHLRTLTLVNTDLGLALDADYEENFAANLNKMVEEATSWDSEESVSRSEQQQVDPFEVK
jgi:hypothetical protein